MLTGRESLNAGRNGAPRVLVDARLETSSDEPGRGGRGIGGGGDSGGREAVGVGGVELRVLERAERLERLEFRVVVRESEIISTVAG
jgi:hypothetical protein